MQIQSKYNTPVKLLLPVDRGFLVKTWSEAQSRVSRPYKSRFSPYKFLFFLVFSYFNFLFLVKIFVFSLSLFIVFDLPTILSISSSASRFVACNGGLNGVLILLLVFVVWVCSCTYWALAECGLATVDCNTSPEIKCIKLVMSILWKRAWYFFMIIIKGNTYICEALQQKVP